MNKQYWVFLAFMSLIFPLNFQSVEAQDVIVCKQNALYWERWQENFEYRAYMTGSVWNVTSFDVSPDGEMLAVANGNSLTLYNTQTLFPLVELESADIIQNGSYQAINWSPDGNQLAATYSIFDSPDNPNPLNGIQIWDVEQQQQVELLPGRTRAMAWSPDGLFIAQADVKGDIWLWDLTTVTATKLYERELPGSIMNTLAWSPDGHYLAASQDAGGPLHLYRIGEGEPQLLESPEKTVAYITWSPDSNQVVIGNQIAWNLFIFDISTAEITGTLNGGKGNPFDVRWSPDGRRLARGTQRGLYIWDMTSDDMSPAYAFEEHMPPFVRMDWTPDSQFLISVDFEGSLYRWNAETGCVEAAYLKEWRPS